MERRHFGELEPDTRIPVTLAHKAVGVGRSTVYRWLADGDLVADRATRPPTVTIAEVRAAEAIVNARRRASAEGASRVGANEIT